MNKEVSFPIAKLLKEKGFDEPTHSFYVIDESEYGEIGEFITNPNDNYPTLDDNSLFDTLASAPIIAEVIMWLYEKHGIWIYSYKIEPFVYDDTPYPKYVWISMCDEKFINTDNGLAINHHHSPTEAYSAAIEYALKNLIK